MSFLENMSFGDIWIANRYISGDANDGGKTRILTLKLSPPVGLDAPTVEAASNEDKSMMLAKLMFPAHLAMCPIPSDHSYPPLLPAPARITAEQVHRHIEALSSYKAPGQDGIPNTVLKACTVIVIPGLMPIFHAILKLQSYPPHWRDSITCIL